MTDSDKTARLDAQAHWLSEHEHLGPEEKEYQFLLEFPPISEIDQMRLNALKAIVKTDKKADALREKDIHHAQTQFFAVRNIVREQQSVLEDCTKDFDFVQKKKHSDWSELDLIKADNAIWNVSHIVRELNKYV